MSEQKKPSIEIEHFSFYYPEQAEKTLDDLTLTVERGEFLVLWRPVRLWEIHVAASAQDRTGPPWPPDGSHPL